MNHKAAIKLLLLALHKLAKTDQLVFFNKIFNIIYASISPSRIAGIKLAEMKYVLSSVQKGNTKHTME